MVRRSATKKASVAHVCCSTRWKQEATDVLEKLPPAAPDLDGDATGTVLFGAGSIFLESSSAGRVPAARVHRQSGAHGSAAQKAHESARQKPNPKSSTWQHPPTSRLPSLLHAPDVHERAHAIAAHILEMAARAPNGRPEAAARSALAR